MSLIFFVYLFNNDKNLFEKRTEDVGQKSAFISHLFWRDE